MIFLISPAKSLNESLVTDDLAVTSPRFGKDTDGLIKVMQKKKPKEIVDLMGVSKGLADLNYQRYQDFTNQTEKPCVLMFDGDVYRGLQAETLDSEGLKFAQDHLRIAHAQPALAGRGGAEQNRVCTGHARRRARIAAAAVRERRRAGACVRRAHERALPGAAGHSAP